MTRETKIGLLVGLAFIIVIGILLSDHINSSTDPMRADVTETFKSVEQGVNSPDARPKGTDVVVTPRPVVPQNPVPVQPDSQPRQNTGQTIVTVGPGGDPSTVELPTRLAPPSSGQSDPVVQGDTTSTNQNTQVANNDLPKQTNTGGVSAELLNEVHKGGEEIVNPGNGAPVGFSPGPNVTLKPSTPSSTANTKQVKAEEGDTVSKLAAKFMGGNTRANRDAIIKANPSVGPDGSKVFAGRTYIMPAADASVAVKATESGPEPVNPTRETRGNSQSAPAPAGTTWYTVKENDNLWKIASEQLGSGARWTEIKELNGLKSDDVRANMRLKLPVKSVASNN